jgi:hypothetical protein
MTGSDGENPVRVVPGDTPTSPLIMVQLGEAVTVEPAKMAKLSASPREGDVCASAGEAPHKSVAKPSNAGRYKDLLDVVFRIMRIVSHTPRDPVRVIGAKEPR